MSNRFTERAQRVILIAQEEAKRLNQRCAGENVGRGRGLWDGAKARVESEVIARMR